MPRLVSHNLSFDEYMAKKYRRRAAWPESEAGWFSRIMYTFLDPLLALGAEQGRVLSASDLYETPDEESSIKLSKLFNEYFQSPINKSKNGFDRLCSSLWSLIKPLMMKAGICHFIACSLQVILPMLVRELVVAASHEDVNEARRLGLRGAGFVAGCVIAQGLSQQMQMHLAMRAGQRMRATIVAEVFDTALHLTAAGRSGLSKGEITNLVSIDAQKVFEVTLHLHLLWSSPLQILAVSILLYMISGPTALLGILTLAGVLPLAKMIVKEMLRIRSLRMVVTDERVRIVTEVLEGIRVTKLNGWEPLWAQRLLQVRNQEVKYSRQELFVYGCTMVVMVVSPVFAILAAVAAKMLSDNDARLTAPDAFATVALIGALRFPINELGNLLGQSAQAYRAAERISRFLARETKSSKQETKDQKHSAKQQGEEQLPNKSPFLLQVEGISFQVGGNLVELDKDNSDPNVPINKNDDEEDKTHDEFKSQGYVLNNVSLSVGKSEVVAVVGGVATGKSLLLNGILGNANQIKGKTPILPKLAYCSQQPFVLNATVKNNILFGKRYDEERYNKALHASCLINDLLILPAGDNTEIGERGVTLSGGQKARVGLARAVYAFREGDVCCLDDPLGALDASTAITVFDRLFGESGVFSIGGVILVTHAVHLLSRPEITKILLLDHHVERENDTGEFSSNETEGGGITKQTDNDLKKQQVIRGGHVAFYGSWSELQDQVNSTPLKKKNNNRHSLKGLVKAIASQNNDFVDNIDEKGIQKNSTGGGKVEKYERGKRQHDGKLTQAEEREEGVASLGTWRRWVEAAGGLLFLFVQFTTLSLDRLSYISCEWWLAKWSAAEKKTVNVFGTEFPAQSEHGSAWEWSKVYFCLGFASVLFCFMRTQWGLLGGIRAANVLYRDASRKLLLAPMGFFDSTPLGRLLHRLSYDTEVVDIVLSQKATNVLVSCGWMISGIIIMTAISQGIMLLFIMPTLYMVYRLQLFYRRSAVDLQRLDATSRSPLQSLLVEGLEGASTINAFQVQPYFLHKLREALDENTVALLCWTTAQRWLGLRLDLLAAVICVGAASVIACFRDDLNLTPGLAGMMMVWAFNQSVTIMFLVNSFTEAEAAATSCERLIALEKDTPQEAPHMSQEDEDAKALLMTTHHSDNTPFSRLKRTCASCLVPSSTMQPSSAVNSSSVYTQAPCGWPKSGEIRFDNVFLRYRKGLDLALRGLSFTVPSGSRCGIVGRTGAGKSTIVSALFRLAEEPLSGGRVLLDGIDLSTLYLKDVRARKPHGMVVIPQDPVLFSGTLRDCLDPFNGYEDHELLESLRAVGINTDRNEEKKSSQNSKSPSDTRKQNILEASVHEGGSNWSVGERQLLALARALLEKPRVLILDEATASVDGDTDARIQHMLRNSPHLANQVTVLSVAHRLNTVMDFDNILVLDNGIAAEFGKPSQLLKNKLGALSKLVDATGSSNSNALRIMASQCLPPSSSPPLVSSPVIALPQGLSLHQHHGSNDGEADEFLKPFL